MVLNVMYKPYKAKMDINKVMDVLNEIKEDLKTKSTSTELQELVSKLEEKEVRIVALESSVVSINEQTKLRDDKINELEKQMDLLDTRTRSTERQNSLLEHTVSLLERKCDDHEQISRKVNLRFVGIDIKDDETPDTLLATIKAECTKLGLAIDDADFDHCHRNGRINSTGNVRKQTVLLKMRSWRGRNIIYENRRNFPFKIYHDLTLRRKTLLDDANEMIESPDVNRVVDFAMADKNCKLKLKSSNGRYFHFNSLEEFNGTVQRLQNDSMGSGFTHDEKDELFR